MIFYLTLAILFTIYALDLLLLVVVSAIARSAEVAALLRKRRKENAAKQKQKQKSEAAAAAAAGGVSAASAGSSAFSDVRSESEGSEVDPARRPARAAATPVVRPVVLATMEPMGPVIQLGPVGSGDVESIGPEPSEETGSEDDGAHAKAISAGAPAGIAHTISQLLGAGKWNVPPGERQPSPDTNAEAKHDDPYGGVKPPKVVIQLPMYNEEAHADIIIERCCKLKYPRDRLLIQVLDDSTKEAVRNKVDDAAALCIENGHPVQVIRRDNRSGFKAGAMVEGLNRIEGLGFEYCAIFDADFDPPADFLEECIPRMHTDKRLAYVQTRWAFANGNESFLTWAQKVNLSFHFDVEQRARSYLGWFFNFNGTAGVWRIQAIHDAGGWQSDTVVEDMDLSLRCYLKGWSALYLAHVDNPNELPCTLSSYKTQQFRWLSGPMQILNKSFSNIWRAQGISLYRRLNAFWFFLRYILFAVITVGVLAIPPVALWGEAWDWKWPQIYFIVAINFALAVYLYVTPFSIAYLFFSVAIGYFKLYAMVNGLVGGKKSKTWKVTQKYGAAQQGGSIFHRMHKPYALELILALYYTGMAVAAGLYTSWIMLGYCVLMALVFLAISFGDAYM